MDVMTPDVNYVAYDQDQTYEDAYDGADGETFVGETDDGAVVYRYLEKDIDEDSEEDTQAAFDLYIPETHPLYNLATLSLYKRRVAREVDSVVIRQLMKMLQSV